MDTSSIIFALALLVLVVVLLYYFFYIYPDETSEKKEIPYKLLYEQDKTIVDLLEDISKKYGRYPALKKKVKGRWQTTTYSEYCRNARSFAERLLYYIGPNPHVAILSFNRPEWFCAHLGTLTACGTSIGIYPTATDSNCSYIVNHSCIDVLIVEDSKQLVKFKDVKMPTVRIILVFDHEDVLDNPDDELLGSIKKNNPSLIVIPYINFLTQHIGSITTETVIEIRKPYPEDTATIIYTSGTTGDPKGVVITHKNIIGALKASLRAIQLRSNVNIYMQETYISYLPLNHVAAQMMDVYVPIASVGVVYFAEKDAMKGSLKDTIKEVRPTIFIGVPRIWEKIHEKIVETKEDPQKFINKLFVNNIIIQEMGFDRAKYLISAAAPISKEIKDFFKDLGLEICDVYGMSETTGPISMAVPGCSNGSGVPVLDVKIDRETKEIMVKGESVFKEYYKNKKATEESFHKKGWLKTGDTGYIDRDGSLIVTGRIKDLIITAGGENVSPVPIEESLIAEMNHDQKLFGYAVVIGDQRKFLSVLLVPSKQYNSMKDNEKRDAETTIKKAIEITNKKAPNSTSTVKKYKILDDVTFEVGEFLTPTYKIRRSNISDKFKDVIDKLYEENNE